MRLLRHPCPICDGRQNGGVPAPAPWELAWCASCDFTYMTNPPDCEAMTEEFEWEQSYYAEKKRRYEAHGRVGGAIAKFVASARQGYRNVSRRNKLHDVVHETGMQGEVLDIGCGNGHLWPRLPANVVPVGIELSPVLARQGRERIGDGAGRLIEADALGGLQQLPDASMNGAIAVSFLEHEVRPTQVVRELRRVLRKGAAFVIKVPNYACWNRRIRGSRWCGFRFPDHVNYFTPRALRRLFEMNSYTVARFRRRDRMPTSDNMWCVARTTCAAIVSAITHPEWAVLVAL